MILPYFILLIIFVAYYILFLWFYLFSNDFINNSAASLIVDFWKEEFGREPLFISHKILSTSFLCNFGILSFTVSVEYALIYYYSTQISKTLKTHIDSNTASTKVLHRQIQRTLFIQAIGPSVISSVPVMLVIFKSLLQIKSNEISLIVSLMFPWVSMCNPLAALIMIKPYRNNLKIALRCLLKPFRRHGKTSKIIPAVNKN